jgi:hypothetical protein
LGDPPQPFCQLGHGGGSSGADPANPALTVDADMPRPAATAAAAARRLMDIRCVPSRASVRTCQWARARYGQVKSNSNGLVIGFGCCGLLTSAPLAVPLIW